MLGRKQHNRIVDLVHVLHEFGDDYLPYLVLGALVVELDGDIAGFFDASQGMGIVRYRTVYLPIG